MKDAQIIFANPQWFFAFMLLVGVAILRYVSQARSTKLLDQMVASRLKTQLLGAHHPIRRELKFWLFMIGLAGIITALARPQKGFQDSSATRKGLDIMFALDTSKSMLAEDIQPNRLDRAKFAILDMMEILEGDRIGLVGFAGDAFLQCPLTTDYTAFSRILEEADTDLLPTGGTNIASAIKESLKGFTQSESDNRALILITDGEELDAEAVPSAREAFDTQGVRVFTLGFGTPEGTQIRITENGRSKVVVDPDGKPVISRLQETLLRDVADAAGGFYSRFEGTATLKRLVTDGFGMMTRQEIETRAQRIAFEFYHWPLSIGLLFLVCSLVIHEAPRLRQSAPTD
ncbi:MAG: Ca-activated chloride channel family protein [Verrucomicrobiales bacterium]|jgi:Ca-activated chloride channel family protein